MNLLNPLFLLGGLSALVPVLLHLVKRERAQTFEFPTLMYLRRVSRKSIRFQKLRHLLLLALRVLTLVLLTLSFTRPFSESPQSALARGRVTEAHVILVDNSMSMAYGDRWSRARETAAAIVRGAPAGDKVALLEFSNRTVTLSPLTTESDAVLRAIDDGLRLTDQPTRFDQALRAAEQAALDAGAGRRIIHLISDFQRSAWASGEQEFRLGPGVELQPVDVSGTAYSNLVPADVQVIETDREGKSSLKIRLAVVNFGTEDRRGIPVTLRLDDKVVDEKRANIAHGAIERFEFDVPGLAPGEHSLVIETGDDSMQRDNRFFLVARIRGRATVLSVEEPRLSRGGRPASFFLSRAVNVAGISPYQLTAIGPREAELQTPTAAAVVVWNGASGGSPQVQQQLRQFVAGGNGLAVVVPNAAAAADFDRTFSAWIPIRAAAEPRAARRRSSEDYSLLTDIRFDHAIFRPFGEPHSGNFSSARFFDHAVLVPGEGAQVLARFDSGDPAVIAADIGDGRVIVLSFAADDSSNDLPLKAVYAPFWQQILRHLHRQRGERRWVEVGDSIEPRKLLAESLPDQRVRALDNSQPVVVLDPSGQRLPSGAAGDSFISEMAGFYELRTAGAGLRVAVNTVPGESDLTPGNAEEMAAGWLSNEAASASLPAEALTAEEQEKRQSLWQFLLIAAVVCFLGEGWLSNRSVLRPE